MSADVIFLYDQVVEHLVRLRWFASSDDLALPDAISDDLDHVADLLAKRDLLVFAASLRNFAEATGSIALMKKVSARLSEATDTGPPYHRDATESITLHQMLSRILHAHTILVIRHPIMLVGWEAAMTTHISLVAEKAELKDPLVRLWTDKDGDSLIKVEALVTMSCSYLAKAVEVLGSKMMLSRVDRDGGL